MPDPHNEDPLERIRRISLKLLAAREHCAAELRAKLLRRGFADDAVDPVLARLLENGLLSDERFVEGYVEERAGKGFGPRRIRAELLERAVAEELIQRYLPTDDDYWMRQMARASAKKFAGPLPSDRSELARRARFLEYRGFTAAQVSRFLRFGD